MTRMTGPDCVVMCNLINTYIHAYIHTYIHTYIHYDSRPAPDLRLVVHPVPYGLWGVFRVTACFGKIVEEDLLRNRWVQQP